MKKQYNFLKAIDTTSSSGNASPIEPRDHNHTTTNKSQKQQDNQLKVAKGLSLSKLQSFTKLIGQQDSSEKLNGTRNAKLFSLSANINQHYNNEQEERMSLSSSSKNQPQLQQTPNKSAKIIPTTATSNSSHNPPHHHHQRNQLLLSARHHRQQQAVIGGAHSSNHNQMASSAEFSARRLKQQVEAAAAIANTATSEKITPELAKCYEEIDQIYDYIRGLAPLPIQLRKIKSIDFEQLEQRERQLKLQKQQQQQQQQREHQQLTSELGLNNPASSKQLAPKNRPQKSPKQRQQRDGSPPPPPPLTKTTSGRTKLIQGPLPIKVVTATIVGAPTKQTKTVNRVESLNLGRGSPSDDSRPDYLISGSQRNQLFRLPRAHSTSTLAKPNDAKTATLPFKLNQEPEAAGDTASASLGRLRTRLFNVAERPSSMEAGKRSNGKQIVEEEQSSENSSMTTQSTTSEENSDLVTSNDSSSSSSSSDSNSDDDQSESQTSNSSARLSEQLAKAQTKAKEMRETRAETRAKVASSSAEKSHSDYENDSASLSASTYSDHSDDLIRDESNNSKRSNRSSSSGRPESRKSSSTERQRRSQASETKAKVEHIYEQIPAHKSMKQLTNKENYLFHQDSKPRSRAQQHHPLAESQRPFNYPIAYAPNIAHSTKADPRQHQFISGRKLSNFPPPMMAKVVMAPYAMNSKSPKMQHFDNYHKMLAMQQRPLDHRYRLSMSNLHMLPSNWAPLNHHQLVFRQNATLDFMGRPTKFASGVDPKLSRSSSSSKVNRLLPLRAPRLSPTQLLAQIQVPRAVSKRQVTRHSITGDDQLLAAYHPTSHLMNQRVPVQQHPSKNRHSARRLTAIGIEDAIDFSRLQQQSQSSARLNDQSRAILQTSTSSKDEDLLRKSKQQFFEPPQLMKAPLIDEEEAESINQDDDDDDGEEDEEEDDDNHSATASSSANCPAGDQVNDKRGKSSSNERAMMNSISSSDLHSFSSSSSSQSTATTTTSDQLESSNSCSKKQQVTGNEQSNADRLHAASTSTRPNDKIARDDSNFVSSRSFIKCYYGKEAPASSSNKTKVDAVASKLASKSAPKATTTGRKLLNLIGLDTAHSSSGGSNSDTRQNIASKSDKCTSSRESERSGSNKRRGVVSQPQIGSIFVNVATSKAAKPAPVEAKLVGEFLNAEGPILIRDKRLASLKADLVRHYEHPTVKVAKVPSYSPLPVAKLNLAASTGTTNSTSSYEAAMKNARELSDLKAVKGGSKPPQEEPLVYRKLASSSSSNSGRKLSSSSKVSGSSSNQLAPSSSLIRVPKLSKQSHLLNRPLPQPPVQSSYAKSPISLSASTRAVLPQSGSRPRVKQPVSTNLDATSPPAYETRISNRPTAATNTTTGSRQLSVSKSLVRNSMNRQANKQAEQINTTTSNAMEGNYSTNKISPLSVSLSSQAQPSPTVTTYTSSGISSRLTSGTANQLAASNVSSSAGSGRSTARAIVRSKQQQQQQLLNNASPATASLGRQLIKQSASNGNKSPLGSKFEQADEFELMDDHRETEQEQQQPDYGHSRRSLDKNRSKQQVALSKSPEIGETNQVMSSNLRLFDERFSSKFNDRHDLASSDDSLLESINFSGTLGRKQPNRC